MNNERKIYTHKQLGYVIIFVSLAIVLFSIRYLYKDNYSSPEFIILISIISLCLLFFYSQTVEITETNVKTSMGIGIIRRNINTGIIVDSKIVKNKWYTGWGIRMIPGGMMFNVSGLSAVELTLKNRNVFRIGTDDPDNLNNTIKNLIKLKS